MTNQTDAPNAALAGRYRIERHLGEVGMGGFRTILIGSIILVWNWTSEVRRIFTRQ